MALKTTDFLIDVYSLHEGKKLHPYKGERGKKTGKFSVSLTGGTRDFQGMTEDELRRAITSGKFRERGTIRMLPLDTKPGDERNAFAPQFYKDKPVKDF